MQRGYNYVYDYIDSHLEHALDDLMRLCRQPSISAQGIGIEETAELVTEMLQRRNVETQILPGVGGGSPVVYGELAGDSPYTLLFYNHYDVQPPEPLEEWTSPPFEPTISDGMLRARGVADNKGSIVARLYAIEAYQQVRGRLPISIKFCIEGEEEIGSPHLTAFVEQNRSLLKADACIWERGDINWQGQPVIAFGVKGLLYVELVVRGAARDVHSSLATVVPNPAWRLVWALASLKDRGEKILISGFYDTVRPPSSQQVDAIAAIPSEDQELKESLGLESFVLELSGLAFERRYLLEPTCNICGLTSGYEGEGSKTVLPCLARAKIDFRLVPDQQPEEILAKLRRHLDENGFVDIDIINLGGENPARTPLDSPFGQVVCQAAKEVYGLDPVVQPTMAVTGPMSCFTDALGIPTVCMGFEYPNNRAHAPDENIRLADFVKGTRHVAAVIDRLGKRA